MCGIFGCTSFDKSNIEKARISLHSLEHRGPDQWHEFHDDSVYMGHHRLSILDLSDHGKQPMVSPDKDVIITVNGEIYNFLKIRKELESKHQFKCDSDSEVILFGYIEWGIDKLLEKIDGMYAISIYDISKNRTYLAKDRVGIKPLYYSNIDGQICWSSELKAIEKYYDNLKIDNTSVYDFLTYRYIPTPKTMYENVFKLEPAHYLEIDPTSNAIKKECYWSLKTTEQEITIDRAETELYQLLNKSIQEQMISDVPVGFFLSGGLDSSTIVSLAAKCHSDINTFSIGFSDKNHDETYFAKLVAEKYTTNHHVKTLNEPEVIQLFPNIKKWYDEPFADSSCFPTYVVSAYAKENVTVVLTGDGGDELFGGYNWYRALYSIKNFS
ncbi:MAG: asparagine synthase (glutamine-hydrolyzing) [Pseudomonadales bacterium]|nr:asparagine synthase (glutamine-hydrolyzing) [Pseudomonadales bacterium]